MVCPLNLVCPREIKYHRNYIRQRKNLVRHMIRCMTLFFIVFSLPECCIKGMFIHSVYMAVHLTFVIRAANNN